MDKEEGKKELNEKTFKVENIKDNIQIPGMVLRNNAGLPTHSKIKIYK